MELGQITGSNFAYQHLPFDRFLDDAADLGRVGLELWGIAPQLHVPRLSNAEADAIGAPPTRSATASATST